jgi:uncharacterized protein (TIGR02444 family)
VITDNPLPEHPFWDFSLRLYARPGVAAACLALQDEYAADVNILLFCCWAGHIGAGPLDQDRLRGLIVATHGWRTDVIQTLRRLRRQLKDPDETVDRQYSEWLRRRVQQIEIDAEHIEQLVLADTAGFVPDPAVSPTQPGDVATANLHHYLALIGVTIDGEVRGHLQTLLAAVFVPMEFGDL